MGALTCFSALTCAPALAGGPPPDYAPMVARYARQHGVPERLVHRVIMRESRYNPRVIAHGNYGLMQIRLGTARGMGYSGAASGLLDPDVNMRHAVAYLANAYITARGNEDLAVRYYAGGYYYAAKRQGLLGRMRTADSGVADEPTKAAPQAQAEIATPRRTAYAPAAAPADATAAIEAGAQQPEETAAPAKSRKPPRKEAKARRVSEAPTPPERPVEAPAPDIVEASEPIPVAGPDPARN